MTRIFDNITTQLRPSLQDTLRTFTTLDVATGYFNLRGWSAFAPIVETLRGGSAIEAATLAAGISDVAPEVAPRPIVRILVGMNTKGPQDEALNELQAQLDGDPLQQTDHVRGKERQAELLGHLREQLMRGLPTAADRSTLQTLRRQVAEGSVQLRVHTRRPLHGKAYIFHRDDEINPRVAFVGSSNLTAAGLSSNYELNVDVVDTDATEKLAAWFEERWEDPFTYAINAELLDLLDESWASQAPRAPYDVYLKLCFDMSRDVRDGLAEYEIAGPIAGQLLDYQKEAVQTLARRLGFRGGTMLGDVVGLGKTITAVAVALLLLEEERYSTLVVCPKNLVGMWEEYLAEYQLPGKVVSYTMAAKVLPDLRRYQLVIVDESHTMRSDTRQDYMALHRYIRDNSSKVLLLTATPYNVGFQDVANQLGLYLDPDTDLGLQPVEAMRNDPRLADRVDGKTSTLAAFRESQEPDDWKRLMSEHLVRRTRTFVKRQAEDAGHVDDRGIYLTFANGDKFYFPARVAAPIEHDFGTDDPAALMATEETLQSLDGLLLPRYDLRQYVRKAGVTLTAEEKELVEKWERGRGQVKGFVRTNFFKRLSSCGHSFLLSLKRHADRNRLFLHALENGLDLPTGTVLDAMFSTADTDEDFDAEDVGTTATAQYAALVERAPASVTWVRASLFKDTLARDLAADTETIDQLLSQFGEWSAAVDSKMASLIALLTEKHPADKVLIFTEYKDTADYVGDVLAAAGIADVAVATGDSEDPTALAHLFSPRSNATPGAESVEPFVAPEDELRVLVATDVLSEGQNLQDGHIVVNYDLPWAIIKLIQRAGRVDRVGQTSPSVTIYSFFHKSVENVLALRKRIRQRLADNAQAFGADEQFFGDESEVSFIQDLYDGRLDPSDLEGDVDAASMAFQVWRKATEADPDLAQRIMSLPDLLTSTQASTNERRQPEGVGCMIRTRAGMDGYGFAPPTGDLRLLTGHEALGLFACEAATPAQPLRPDHDALVASLVSGEGALLARPQLHEGQLRGVRKSVWARLSGSLFEGNPEIAEALDALHRRPLTREAEGKLRKRLGNLQELADTMVALHRSEALVIGSTQNDPIRIVSTMGIVQ